MYGRQSMKRWFRSGRLPQITIEFLTGSPQEIDIDDASKAEPGARMIDEGRSFRVAIMIVFYQLCHVTRHQLNIMTHDFDISKNQILSWKFALTMVRGRIFSNTDGMFPFVCTANSFDNPKLTVIALFDKPDGMQRGRLGWRFTTKVRFSRNFANFGFGPTQKFSF
jgi:hypothetical protein